ncbi:MAG TPA: signal peptidase I [Sideroxyarcus sp.]|nr:signal peptidase I [Sideroxyarcus sp.]
MTFALILFSLLLLTGAIWLLDRYLLRAKRPAGVNEPWWVEYAKSFFPVILAVFLLRSFLVEPFKIPSGSMIPTLHVGDFILVNRYTYGLRLPIVNKKIVEINQPQRGDVMVFHYPEDPSVDYIKRVIGVPGDKLVYRGKRLWINGAEQLLQRDGDYNYVESELRFMHTERYIEKLDGHDHPILINPEMPQVHLDSVRAFPQHEQCSYSEQEVRCTVPAGHYFMMGDNRDNSRDSRYWGFVPDEMIVGKAFFIWMNFGELDRVGLSVN